MNADTTKISNRYLILLGFLCTCLAASCSVVPKTKNDIFIRMANHSPYEITAVTIGRRIIKPDSYSNTNYTTYFKKIGIGETTKYVNTRGKHLALSRLHLSYKGIDRKKMLWGPAEDLVKQAGGILDSIAHPYTGKILSGYVLEKGYYTFSFTFSDTNDEPVFDLVRDK